MNQLPEINLDRLTLRPFKPDDIETVVLLAGAREIADTTCNIPHPYHRKDAEDWINAHPRQFEKRENATFAVTLSDGGELIGTVGLGMNSRHDRAELGYWIGVPYWGNGYCTEAVRAVVAFGFDVLNLVRIHACHLTRNPSSGRVMEKIGMKKEGLFRRHIKKWDIYEDVVIYGILREEWADQS